MYPAARAIVNRSVFSSDRNAAGKVPLTPSKVHFILTKAVRMFPDHNTTRDENVRGIKRAIYNRINKIPRPAGDNPSAGNFSLTPAPSSLSVSMAPSVNSATPTFNQAPYCQEMPGPSRGHYSYCWTLFSLFLLYLGENILVVYRIACNDLVFLFDLLAVMCCEEKFAQFNFCHRSSDRLA